MAPDGGPDARSAGAWREEPRAEAVTAQLAQPRREETSWPQPKLRIAGKIERRDGRGFLSGNLEAADARGRRCGRLS